MIEKHILRLRVRDHISDEEARSIRNAVTEVHDVPIDTVAIRSGVETGASTLLLDGIMARFKDLADGQRQITALHVPGDFVDLHSFTLKRLEHSILTLTPCRIAVVPHAKLAEITERHQHLTRVYWFSTNVDAAIHREWELSLGRRSALSRLAHLFCELELRLRVVGLCEGNSYALKLTQAELAECLGLTPVHVNRVLKELRETGAIEFRSGRVTIYDRDRLHRIAEFDSAYLYLDRHRV